MIEEFPVCYQTRSHASFLLKLDVVIPVSIIVVVVVQRQISGCNTEVLVSANSGLNLIGFRQGVSEEISHALVGCWLNAVIVDIHLFFCCQSHVLQARFFIHSPEGSLHRCELLLLLVFFSRLRGQLQDVCVLVIVLGFGLCAEFLDIKFVEWQLGEHLLAEFAV